MSAIFQQIQPSVYSIRCTIMGVEKVKSQSQIDEAINSGKLVVIDFFATWCGPCKRIAPDLETLSNDNSDVIFLKVDVDECEDIAANYEISSMPTLKFFKNGSQVAEVIGANVPKIKQTVASNK